MLPVAKLIVKCLAAGDERGNRTQWSGEDFCTHAGAVKLAGQIREYWRKRGYPEVKVWVEEKPVKTNANSTSAHDRSPVYTVRSNIGPNGLPSA